MLNNMPYNMASPARSNFCFVSSMQFDLPKINTRFLLVRL